MVEAARENVMLTNLSELKEMGKLTLEDIAGSLNDKISGDRAMEIAESLMKPLMDETFTPQEWLSGCVMGIMKLLAAANEVKKTQDFEKEVTN